MAASALLRVVLVVVMLNLANAKKSAKQQKRKRYDEDHSCRFSLEPYKPAHTRDFFFCDKTSHRLYAASSSSGGAEWVMAAPTKDKGCHEYAAYEGTAPPGCVVGKACAACAAPKGKYLNSAYFENAGKTCPVKQSLRPEVEVNIQFEYVE